MFNFNELSSFYDLAESIINCYIEQVCKTKKYSVYKVYIVDLSKI